MHTSRLLRSLSIVAPGWAGLQTRKDVNEIHIEVWPCRSTDPSFPTLTVDYLLP
jgi:hypothetical protein